MYPLCAALQAALFLQACPSWSLRNLWRLEQHRRFNPGAIPRCTHASVGIEAQTRRQTAFAARLDNRTGNIATRHFPRTTESHRHVRRLIDVTLAAVCSAGCLSIMSGFQFDGRNVAWKRRWWLNKSVQLGGTEFDYFDGPPGLATLDQLGVVEAVDRLGECVVQVVSNRADRGCDAGLCEPLA